MLRVAMIAGEPSGDTLGADLIRHLKVKHPDIQIEGVGGQKMQDAGCVIWEKLDRLSVIGISEVIRRYFEFRNFQQQLTARIIDWQPDVFVGIDAPEFNLGIEKKLRAHKIKTVHYVSPSVWGWREYRLSLMREAIDLLLVLFPFEERYFQNKLIPYQYVGHPLAGRLQATEEKRIQALQRYGYGAADQVLALLPGSRNAEISYLLNSYLATARFCLRQLPNLRIIIPVVSHKHARIVQEALVRLDLHNVTQIIMADTESALMASQVALVTSGTATLEAMFLNCPMVVAYRGSWLSYFVIRPLMKVNYFSLPNLIAGQQIVPEFLQHQATPRNLAPAVLKLLQSADARQAQLKSFGHWHQKMQMETGQMAAHNVLTLVNT